VLLGFVAFFGSIFEAVGVGSILPFVDILQNKAAVLKYNRYLTSLGFNELDYHSLLFLISVCFVSVILLKNLFLVGTNFVQSAFQNMVRASLSTEIYSNYLGREYNFFVVHSQGLLVQRLTSVVDQATGALAMSTTIIVNLITISFVYAVLAVVSLKLTLMVTVLIVVLSIVVGGVSRYRAYVSGKEIVSLEGLMFNTAVETIGGMRIIRAFGAESYVKKRFNGIVNRLARIRIINTTIFSVPTPAIETILVLGLCTFVVISASTEGSVGGMIPLLSMFGVGLIRITQKVSMCYTQFMSLSNFLPSVNVAVDLMRDVTFVEMKDAKKIDGVKNEIRLENVTFAYPQAPDQKVLKNVSLRVGLRQFVAIVGPSGSGKSTIVDLLLRLYHPTEGEILIDNQDTLESIDINDWRERFGLVSQDIFLFNGTIKENIAFASSEIDVEKVENSARQANAHQFICELPQGYNTEIGERGIKLSGGERQRLAIARALYRDPEIIILDEATSSLDTQAEQEVQKALDNLEEERTFIAIAHRLSTIRGADRIYVLKDGEIVEEGNHRTLVQKKGIYWDLCCRQNISV